MKVIRPVLVTGAVLASSSVAEADYPTWSAALTYALGDRVIKTATHRIYESVLDDNVGHDPAGAGETAWTDVGPTNRWAMFDAAGGPRTVDAGPIVVKLAPEAPVSSLGMLDVGAATVRVQVSAAGVTIYDDIAFDGATNLTFLDLPAVTGQQITVTITAAPGANATVGKLVIGDAFDLGPTEDGSTASITDFSKRETDDFGVTTVVQRAWARRVTTRSLLSAAQVDAVQRYVAGIRAVPVMWIGDESFEGLSLYGFFKDFSVDVELGDTSSCSLTIEGMPSADVAVPLLDPATQGESDLLVLAPIDATDDILQASNVAENEYPQWSAATTYELGDRVVWPNTHRVYESLVTGNVGKDTSDVSAWLDVGPTNRWAMFDQALGTVTEQANSIVVMLKSPSPVTGLAVLDSNAASVRVQAAGLDQTIEVPAADTGSAVTFLDLAIPADTAFTVTISAATAGALVSVGTLLFGQVLPLGVTENTPTVGITDYSRKNTDDFGNTVAVERAWAKRMDVRSLVATRSVDPLTRNMASLRARPALWIAQAGFDSLTVYGFFRDFTATLSERTTACSFTIEGLSKAEKTVDVDTTAATVVVYRNATAKPAAPRFNTGLEPEGWTSAPHDLGTGEYRWQTQADFRGSDQRSEWSTPVSVAGTNWSDVIDDDPDHPKPEDGATVGATPDEQAQLVALNASAAQAEIDIANAQATLVDVQTAAAATQAELVTAQDAILATQDDIIAIGGDITTLQTTQSNQAAQIGTLQTTVSNQAGTLAALSSTVSTQGATISQNATAITALQGSVASLSTTVTTQGASITSLQTASTTQAGQLATLTTKVSSGNPNLLYNGDFANGFDGWTLNLGTWVLAQTSAPLGQHAYVTNPVNTVFITSIPRAVAPGAAYTVSARGRVTGTGGRAYIDLVFYDSSGNALPDPGDSANWLPGSNFTDAGNRDDHTFTATAPSNAATVSARFVGVGVSGQTTQIAVQQIKLEVGSTATAWSQESTIISAYTTLQTTTTQLASLTTTVSTQGASITANGTAITTLQTQTANLTTTVAASSGPNLIANGGFENGLTGWGPGQQGGAPATGWFQTTWAWGTYAANTTSWTNGYANLLGSRVPLQAGVNITLAGDCDVQGTGTGGVAYMEIVWYGSSDNYLSQTSGPQIAVPTGFDTTGTKRATLKITGTAPANAFYFRPNLVVYAPSTRTITGMAWRQIKGEFNTIATPYSGEASAVQTFQAIQTTNTQVASLSTTVSTQGVTITSQQTAITTLNSNVTTLFGKVGVTIDVNGYLTGWTLNNNGQAGSFVINADYFSIRKPGGGNRTEYSNGVWTVYAGSMLSAWGVAFGSTNQFVRWFGPAQSNLANCTEANAIEYLKVDGSAYFGGAITTGTFRNSITGTLNTDPSSETVLGPFSTNGNTKSVNVSAIYSLNRGGFTVGPTITAANTPSFRVTLYRSRDGSAWTQIAQYSFNGVYSYTPASGGDPGNISMSISGSFTFSDTGGTGASPMYYRAVIDNRVFPTYSGTSSQAAVSSQRCTIISTE